MPRATNNIEVQRFDLKTCPEGYVELRRMTYGQFMKRQGMAMEMQMRMGSGKNADRVVDMDIDQERVTLFEFATCIAAHNLTDDQDALLNFKHAAHVAILDPRVGQEIAQYIDEMNQAVVEDEGN